MDQNRLVKILSDLPTALLEDFELEDVMTSLGDDIAEILEVAGAGVMLEDDRGRLRFVVGSDPILKDLERLQVEFDEGPCLLAYRSGEVVHSEDLASEDRFPRFSAAACDVGMGAVFSYPLRYRGDVIGALNLYDTKPRPLGHEADEAGRTLAPCSAGTRPKSRAVPMATPAVKSSTVESMPMPPRRGRLAGRSAARATSPTRQTSSASTPPANASIRLSISKRRTRRVAPAPRAA